MSCLDIERMLYPCSELDSDNYMGISAAELEYMRAEFIAGNQKPSIFAYDRRVGNSFFVDAYIWDLELENHFKRFVIRFGYVLKPQDEEILIRYCRMKACRYCGGRKADNWIAKLYPQIYAKLGHSDLKRDLVHFYFAMHQGPRGVLFDVGLDELALGLHEIEEVNMSGKCPQEIFDDMEMETLRWLNIPLGVQILNKYGFGLIQEICRENQWLTPEKQLTDEDQFLYLKDMYEQGQMAEEETYKYLGWYRKIWEEHNYLEYKRYRSMVEVIGDTYPLDKFPAELSEEITTAELLICSMEDEEYFDRMLDERYDMVKGYEFSDEKYTMLYLHTVKDYIREAKMHYRGAGDGIIKALNGCRSFFFMRKTEEPGEPYIAIVEWAFGDHTWPKREKNA